MTSRWSFAASSGVSSPVAAIVNVIVVCASGVGIVELQLSSANSGSLDVSISTITSTFTQTTQSSTGRAAQVTVRSINLSYGGPSNIPFGYLCSGSLFGVSGVPSIEFTNNGTAP